MKHALVLALAIVSVNIALHRRAFLPGESPHRRSIELSYAGMARFVKNHPSFWGWKPIQYGGLPTAFQYVPGLPYATAVTSALTGANHERVHRVITAAGAAMLPASAFLLMFWFTRSLSWSLLAGLVITFFSPIYGLIPQMDRDRSASHLPWRWHLLVKYGEGPHNVGLALIPLAIIAVTSYAQRGLRVLRVLAAVSLTVIPLVNWVAALALAITMCCYMLATLGLPDKHVWRVRAVAAAALAYLLACFALTPTFIKTIAFNWPVDSPDFHALQQQRMALVALTVGALMLKALLLWWRADFYTTFVTITAFVFGYILVRFGFGNVHVIPEAHRYAMEFELFLLLTLTVWAKAGWNSGSRPRRICVSVAAIAMLVQGAHQPFELLTRNWSWYKPVNTAQTVEYQLGRWLNGHTTGGRALLSGGLRFRINSWFDVPQVGGGFESGLKNRVPVEWASEIRHNLHDTERGIERMKTLGVEYVVVHGPGSSEYYKDYANPSKFEGHLEKVFTLGDNAIYRVPFSSLASSGSTPVLFRWVDPGQAEISNLRFTERVLVRVSADPGWQAWQDGRELRIERDASGFMLLTPVNLGRIDLRFGPTTEQVAFAVISMAAWLYCGWLLLRRMINVPTAKRERIVKTRPTVTSSGV